MARVAGKAKKVVVTAAAERPSRARRATNATYIEPEEQDEPEVEMGPKPAKGRKRKAVEPEEEEAQLDVPAPNPTRSRKRKAVETAPKVESESKPIRGRKAAKTTVSKAGVKGKQATHAAPTSTKPAAILQLPAELLQEICLLLPFASDAVSLNHTCHTLQNALNSNYFWFKRRRQYEVHDSRKPRWGPLSVAFVAAPVKKDMSEPYVEKFNYRDAVLKAWRGPGLDVEKADSASPEPETKGKKKGTQKEMLRCQICCMQKAYKVWDSFRMAICPGCFELQTIDKHLIQHFKKLDLSKLTNQQRRGGGMTGQGKRHCFRLSSVEQQVALNYPGETLTSLLSARSSAAADRAAEAEAYRTRHHAMLVSHITSTYSTAPFQPFHHIIPPYLISSIAPKFANTATRGTNLQPRKTDKGKDWLLSHSTSLFAFFFNTPGNTTPYNNELNYRAGLFHRDRFLAVGAGRKPYYLEGTDTADGKYLIGVCPTCYARAVESKREKGTEWNLAEQEGSDAQYLTAEQFAWHWVGRADHDREKVVLQDGGGKGWFQFLEGVEGARPLRMAEEEEWPRVVIP